jgi:hypothetical protein
MRRLVLLLGCMVSFASVAQDRDVQRALIQRQLQSEEFALQLRQSQQRLQLIPGDLNQQQYLDAQQLTERQRLENLGAQQQLSIGQAVPGTSLQQRQQGDRDRQMELQRPFELRLPPPQVRAPITPRPKDPVPYFPSYN